MYGTLYICSILLLREFIRRNKTTYTGSSRKTYSICHFKAHWPLRFFVHVTGENERKTNVYRGRKKNSKATRHTIKLNGRFGGRKKKTNSKTNVSMRAWMLLCCEWGIRGLEENKSNQTKNIYDVTHEAKRSEEREDKPVMR